MLSFYLNWVIETDWYVVSDKAKEVVAREKKVDTSALAALPKVAKLIWKAPKLFIVRVY